MSGERPSYREQRPNAPLGAFVQCYWCIRASAAVPVVNRVCPDGCADLIFDLSGSLFQPGTAAAGRAYAVGTMRRAAPVPLSGTVHLVGVRFRPGASAALFRVPMQELTDRTVPISEFWPEADGLGSQLLEAQPPGSSVDLIERILLERLRTAPAQDSAVRAAVRFIARTGGTRPARELEGVVGIGSRQLERRFRAAVGLSPKAFGRVVRFRRALVALQRPGPLSWALLALEGGYYDQAHLIREFRALAGAPPGRLRGELRQVGFVQYESAIPE